MRIWQSGIAVLFETISAQVAGAVFALVNAAIVTHSLSRADAGIFFIVAGVAAIGGIIGSFGSNGSSAVFIGKSKADRDTARERGAIEAILALLLVVNCFFFAVLVGTPLISIGVSAWNVPEIVDLSLPISLQLAGISFALGNASILLALGQTRLAGWLRYAVPNLLICVFLYAMRFAERLTLDSVLWCYAAGFVFVGLVSTFFVMRSSMRLSSYSIRPSLKLLLGVSVSMMGAQTLAGLADYGVLWIAALVLSIEDIALLGVAQRVAMGCLTVFRVSTFLYMPIAARHFAAGQADRLQLLSRVIGFLMVAPLIPILIVTVTVGGAILDRLFGHGYAPAWILLACLFVGYAIRGLAGPGEFLLQMAGRQNTVLLFNTLFVGGVMVGSYFLGGKYGALGVALNIAISYAVLHIIYFAICRRAYGFRINATFSPSCIRAGLVELQAS